MMKEAEHYIDTRAGIGKRLNSYRNNEHFEEGAVILYSLCHTVGESEHMQLTILTRNIHPLHFDEVYCRERSVTKADWCSRGWLRLQAATRMRTLYGR